MRIGLLSDTHIPDGTIRDPWPEVAEAFQGVDLILHGGDIVHPRCLDWLERIAPVLAALGNNDAGLETDPRVKPTQILEIEGWRLGLIHDLEPEDRPVSYLMEHFFREPVDIMVSGHTHWERLELRDGVLMINSGSPNLPHLFSTRLGTVGLLDIQLHQVTASVLRLGDGPLPNPGRELFLEVPREARKGDAS